jgi:uncharacterized UPF0160 family protein
MDVYSDEQYTNFCTAVDLCKKIFHTLLLKHLYNHIEYNKTKDIIQRLELSTILILDNKQYPGMYQVLDNVDPDRNVKLIVHPRGSNWQISTRNRKNERFMPLISLIDSDDAKKIIGDQLIFIHKNRFVGSTTTKDSAIQIAELSLKNHNQK